MNVSNVDVGALKAEILYHYQNPNGFLFKIKYLITQTDKLGSVFPALKFYGQSTLGRNGVACNFKSAIIISKHSGNGSKNKSRTASYAMGTLSFVMNSPIIMIFSRDRCF
jgi:hypothetical protein